MNSIYISNVSVHPFHCSLLIKKQGCKPERNSMVHGVKIDDIESTIAKEKTKGININ